MSVKYYKYCLQFLKLAIQLLSFNYLLFQNEYKTYILVQIYFIPKNTFKLQCYVLFKDWNLLDILHGDNMSAAGLKRAEMDQISKHKFRNQRGFVLTQHCNKTEC